MSNGGLDRAALGRLRAAESTQAFWNQYAIKVVAEIYAPLAVAILASGAEDAEAELAKAADSAVQASQTLLKRLHSSG